MNVFAQTIVVVQFPEDEMHSIQLQMAGLEEPEHHMHTGPHPASNICQTLNC